MRGVDLQVGSKSRPYQEIIIDVMKLSMENMEVVVKEGFQCFKVGTYPKRWPAS